MNFINLNFAQFFTHVFVYLNSVELAKQRVRERVSKGGHNIETEVIERRYYAGLKNFIHLYMSHCDLWLFVDNSAKNFQLNEIASGEFSKAILIKSPTTLLDRTRNIGSFAPSFSQGDFEDCA